MNCCMQPHIPVTTGKPHLEALAWCLQGTFEVRALQPVNYVIEEMDGLLNPANKVSVLLASKPVYANKHVFVCCHIRRTVNQLTCSTQTLFCAAQTLLRGVVPNSFPSRLSFDPALPGERRFVVMDSNVFKLYGHLVQQVC